MNRAARRLSLREERECRKAEIRHGDGPLPAGSTCDDCARFTPRDWYPPGDGDCVAPDGMYQKGASALERPPSWCPRDPLPAACTRMATPGGGRCVCPRCDR